MTNPAATAAPAGTSLEVEVKTRLPTTKAYLAFLHAIQPASEYIATQQQTNHVFDSAPDNLLLSNKTVLRLREVVIKTAAPGVDGIDGTSEVQKKFILYVKKNPLLLDGISRVEEDEHAVTESQAKQFLAEPETFWKYADSIPLVSRLLAHIEKLTGTASRIPLKRIGHFTTTRHVLLWQEFTLEVDRSVYNRPQVAGDVDTVLMLDDCIKYLDESDDAPDTAYEIECETSDPERAKEKLSKFLGEHGIPFANSTQNKVQTMVQLAKRRSSKA